MKKLRAILKKATVLLLFLHAIPAFSEGLRFGDLDVNVRDDLLFTTTTKTKMHEWKNLYRTKLENKEENPAATVAEPKLLTCFPEKMDVFQGGKFLQIRNRDGVFLYSQSKKTLSRLSSNPSLYPSPQNSAKIRDNLAEIAVSPDGQWLCYFEKTSPARGNVMLSSTKTGEKYVLCEDAEFSFEKIPVAWCPDSSSVIYEKNGNLYFINPEDAFSDTLLSESYRTIGAGSIGNVYWASSRLLAYISHDLVFAVSSNELYTRALYAELVGVGKICGRLPSSFDGKRDSFWINEKCNRLVLVEHGRTLWYMELDGTDTDYATTLFSYPFVNVPGTAINFDVFWTPSSAGEQIPLVWLELLRSGKTESRVYKLKKDENSSHAWFEFLTVPPMVKNPKLSPDGKKLSFQGIDFVAVYDISSWNQRNRFAGENIVEHAWIDSATLYVGGEETVRDWNLLNDTLEVRFLSSAATFSWDGSTGGVIASCIAGNFVYRDDRGVWDKTELDITRKAVRRNSFWRVFTDESRNENYQNAVYVRSLAGGNTTKPLLKDFYNENPQTKKIAIVFDALDNGDGIAQVLSVLAKYNLSTTFFLNGEFIRRFPSAVLETVASGHECASMFYTMAKLNSASFVVDEEYIKRGLARNEDEFFELTGEELILAWHAPSYVYSSLLKDASFEAGYTMVSRSINPGDTKTIEYAAKTGLPFIGTSKIVENLAQSFGDGEIIPISCGVSSGTRPDYLYNKLDVLISSILAEGYEIVPVSKIIWN